jgi:membrane dipeptidase
LLSENRDMPTAKRFFAKGLTWNNANLATDGGMEPRDAGGKEIVDYNNKHKILTDVAHLSEKGFWDVMELADYPIASYSYTSIIFVRLAV